MDHNKLADLLFPDVTEVPDDMEKRFPQRELPENACVTRIGPSPTGFVHLGNLYNAIIGERLAHQSGGVFYLRIEDTDSKREVEGAVETVINAMSSVCISMRVLSLTAITAPTALTDSVRERISTTSSLNISFSRARLIRAS